MKDTDTIGAILLRYLSSFVAIDLNTPCLHCGRDQFMFLREDAKTQTPHVTAACVGEGGLCNVVVDISVDGDATLKDVREQVLESLSSRSQDGLVNPVRIPPGDLPDDDQRGVAKYMCSWCQYPIRSRAFREAYARGEKCIECPECHRRIIIPMAEREP